MDYSRHSIYKLPELIPSGNYMTSCEEDDPFSDRNTNDFLYFSVKPTRAAPLSFTETIFEF